MGVGVVRWIRRMVYRSGRGRLVPMVLLVAESAAMPLSAWAQWTLRDTPFTCGVSNCGALNGGNDIVYGNGRWVAVSAGQVMYSSDGITWTGLAAPSTGNWRAVLYDGPAGQKQFVAVSASGTDNNAVMTSPDGINWTLRPVPQVGQWRGLAYGGPAGQEVYVAVSSTGARKVMTSPDGITWTTQDATNDAPTFLNSSLWWSITYGGPEGSRLFVATSVQGTRIMTSPDGITWTARTAPNSNRLNHVDWDNNQFVAVASTGTGNRATTSPDGITWTSRTTPADVDWVGLAYGNGVWVATATSGTGNRIMTSSDGGVTWMLRTYPADNQWFNVEFANGLFVAVAVTGQDRVMTSPDGITWTIRATTANRNWQGVAYGNGRFVAVAQGGMQGVMTSTDGLAWTLRQPAEVNYWRSVAFGNGVFVAVAAGSETGGTNHVMRSTDGINWTAHGGNAVSLVNVTYGGGQFVAVGSNATTANQTVMTSPDGITWTTQTAHAGAWHGVTYGNGLYAAVANNNTASITQRVMTSPDGVMWTLRTTPTYDASLADWRMVAYGSGRFVASATNGSGQLMSSTDGVTWALIDGSGVNSWRHVTFGGGTFVALGNGGGTNIGLSADGVTWRYATEQAASWWSATYGSGRLVAVRNDGESQRVMTREWASTMAVNAGNTQSTPVGAAVTTAPSVVVRDASNMPVANVGVTFAVASGGGSIPGANAVTDVNGIATVGSWTLGATAGANTLTATVDGLTGSPLTFSATGTGPATQLSLNTPADLTAGGSRAAYTVTRRDANLNATTSGGALTVHLSASGTSGVFYDALTGGGAITSVTILVGQSSATFYFAATAAASYTITASDGTPADGATGLADATDPITVTAAAASRLGFAQAPSNATARAAIAPAVTVRIEDPFGNLVSSTDEVTLAVTAATGTAGATLSGTRTIAAAAGVATFSNLSLDRAGTGYTLTATSGSLTVATSATFDIAAAAPGTPTYGTDPPAATTFGTGGTSVVPTLDLGGAASATYAITTPNPVPDGISINASTGVVSWTGALPAGTYTLTITATTAGGTTTAPLTITVSAKPVSTLTVAAIAAQTFTGSALTPLPVVKDGASTLTSPASYTVTYTNNTAVGTATVRLTGAGNYGGDTTVTFTIAAAAPSALTYGATPPAATTFGAGGTSATPTLNAGGGTPTYAITAPSPLPAGITIDPATGIVRWTGTLPAGTYALTITATTAGGTTTAPLTITVSAKAPTNLAFPEPTLTATAGTAGASGAPTLDLGGAATARFAITTPAPVPAGITIDSLTGVVAWTAGTTPATYALTITATTSGGTITAPLSLVLRELPGAPTNVVAAALNAAVAVTWDRPVRDGSSPITGYRVQYTIDDGATWVPAAEVTGADRDSTTITGLTNNAIYRVRVAAVSGLGTGAYSTPSAPVIPAEPVAAPGTTAPPSLGAGETLLLVGGKQEPITLAVVQDTILRLSGGDFTLQLRGLDDEGQPIPIDSAQATLRLQQGAQVRVTGEGFYPGTVITVWLFSEPRRLGQVLVRADGTYDGLLDLPVDIELGRHTLQANGVDRRVVERSASLGVLLDQPAAVLPNAPGDVAATPLDGAAEVVWTAPVYGGGGEILRYVIEVRQVGSATWRDTAVVVMREGLILRHRVPGLTNETAYEFRVAAVNATGRGAPSAPSAPVTPFRPTPVLEITMLASSLEPALGDTVTVTIRVKNTGTGASTGTVVPLPEMPRFTLVSTEATQGTVDRTAWRWTIGRLAIDGEVVLTMRVVVTTGPGAEEQR